MNIDTKLDAAYRSLKQETLDHFRIHKALPSSSAIAITDSFLRIPFDMNLPLLPANILGVASQGYISIQNAVLEGPVIAVFMLIYSAVSDYDVIDMQPDYINIGRGNVIWFELCSRVLNIREMYFIDYKQSPPELIELPPEKMNELITINEVADLFKLHS